MYTLKNIKKKIFILTLFVLMSSHSFCQISIQSTTSSVFNFGSLISISAGGTVTLSTSNSRTASAGIILQSSTTSILDFTLVRGQGGTGNTNTVVITMPSSVTLNRTGGGTLTLGSFTFSPSSSFTLNKGGTQNVKIGGTLTVGNQTASPPGSYATSGTFTYTIVLQ